MAVRYIILRNLALVDLLLLCKEDTHDLDTEQEQLESESEVTMELIRKVIEDNAQKAMDQGEYERKYTGSYIISYYTMCLHSKTCSI